MEIFERVKESLTNAVEENGYLEILEMSDYEIAEDLITYDSELENEDPESLIPHIKKVRYTLLPL